VTDGKDQGALPYGLGAILGSYGLGGLILVLGIVLAGLSIYKGSSFAAGTTQLSVVIGGSLLGLVVIIIGVVLLVRGGPAPSRQLLHGIYIAAPMAGFGADEGGRKAAVDLVNKTQAALQRRGLQNVYTPVVARPDTAQY
jgi:predicted membrane protein